MFTSKFKKMPGLKSLIAIILLTFILPANHLLAAIDVQDARVISNTQTIISNNNVIISNLQDIVKRLSGELPGAQKDNIDARPKLAENKLLLRQMTSNIINWSNTGFEGNPAFILNTGAYLQDATDETINYFVTQDTALNSACEPTQLKQAIGSQYPTFEEKIECTFTDTSARTAFTNGDFIGGGGWDAWLQMTTVPQNNPMGAMLIAQSELDRRIEARQEELTLEANWGEGIMSWKVCNGTPDPDRNYDGCQIRTPGTLIKEKLLAAETSPLRELEMADDFNSLSYILSSAVSATSPYVSMGSLGSGGLSNNRAIIGLGDSYDEYINYIIDIADNSGPGGGGSVNFRPALNNNNLNVDLALQMVNTQMGIENNFLGAQSNILRLLNTTKSILASSTCSASTTNNLIDQLTSTSTLPKTLIWNIAEAEEATLTTSVNLLRLNETGSAIVNFRNANPGTASSDSPEIITLFSNLIAMTSLHSDTLVQQYNTGGAIFNQIKNWIVSKLDSFGTTCTINRAGLAEWGIQPDVALVD